MAIVKLLNGIYSNRLVVIMEEDYKARQEEYKQLVANKLLNIVKRNKG